MRNRTGWRSQPPIGHTVNADLQSQWDIRSLWMLNDNGVGSVFDLCENSLPGTATSGVVQTQFLDRSTGVQVGDADILESSGLSLTASTHRVEIPNSPQANPTDQITLACWVYQRSLPNTDNRCFSKVDAGYTTGWDLRVGSAQQVGFDAYIASNYRTALTANHEAFNDATNYFFAGTYDGANLRIYVGGELCGTTAQTGAIVPGTALVNLGNPSFEGAGTWWDGVIWQAMICGRALLPCDIAALQENRFMVAEPIRRPVTYFATSPPPPPPAAAGFFRDTNLLNGLGVGGPFFSNPLG